MNASSQRISAGLDASVMLEDSRPSRCRLLNELDFVVEGDEAQAEVLSKAFDLSLYNCHTVPLQPSEPHDPASELSQDWLTDFRPPPGRSQNPFLSTPLRLKHFSRLSPSILRDLLRSPSLRSSSLCDDSLDSVVRPYSTAEFDYLPCANPLQSSQQSLPLTPPPSGRIPCLAELPDPDLDPGKPKIVAMFSCHDLPCTAPMTGNFPPPPPNSLVSSATVRNFQRVIDEMKGVDPRDRANYTEDTSSNFALPSPLSSPAGGFFIPEADTSDISRPVDGPRVMDRTLGALEDEFVSLLQQRAIEEEADAKELRALADRLERIGKGRRHLATLIAERKKEQQKCGNEVKGRK
ncbi:hypothetical protein DFH07DRAFT_767490 [Mycena maculata]|uniref:Uncharacterized protein n=1 Tax=Mycena maculata TaxID=230809 RepID=A0AAD7JY45_9AGAR|nr:hypothetical protein DFH07DRAFT_767490 [Mycena maculata]